MFTFIVFTLLENVLANQKIASRNYLSISLTLKSCLNSLKEGRIILRNPNTAYVRSFILSASFCVKAKTNSHFTRTFATKKQVFYF